MKTKRNREILLLFKKGKSQGELAAKYGVTQQYISFVIQRELQDIELTATIHRLLRVGFTKNEAAKMCKISPKKATALLNKERILADM